MHVKLFWKSRIVQGIRQAKMIEDILYLTLLYIEYLESLTCMSGTTPEIVLGETLIENVLYF